MGVLCAILIALLAACGGGSTSTTSGSTSGTLSGGTDISGKTILFEIQSSPSDSFFVPVVNGAKKAAAIAGLKLQVQYASGDDTTEVNQVNTAMASNVIGIAVSIPDAGLNKVVCDARAKNIAVVAFNINGATGQGANCVQSFVGQDFDPDEPRQDRNPDSRPTYEARISPITLPCTSVSRRSMPLWRNVSLS